VAVACSGATPRARSVARRSSRSATISSITSSSRAGGKPAAATRARTSWRRSRTFASDDAADGRDERLPARALLGEDLAPGRGPGGGEAVVAAAPLTGLLDPGPGQPAAALQAVEQRVQRGDGVRDDAVRAALDELPDLVPVAPPVLEEREDEQLAAALLELGIA